MNDYFHTNPLVLYTRIIIRSEHESRIAREEDLKNSGHEASSIMINQIANEGHFIDKTEKFVYKHEMTFQNDRHLRVRGCV